MIQRLQTVYLGLAVLFTALFSVMNLAEITVQNALYSITVFGITDQVNNGAPLFSTTYLGFFVILMAIVQFMTIFLYKNRTKQIRYSAIALISNLGFSGLILYMGSKANQAINGTISYKFAILFALFAAIFLLLAILSIRKDENLIKSLNRIR